jgi:hypothetical protein
MGMRKMAQVTKPYFVHVLVNQGEPRLIGFRNTEPAYPQPTTAGYVVPRSLPDNNTMYGNLQSDWYPTLMMPKHTNELKQTFTAPDARARPIR